MAASEKTMGKLHEMFAQYLMDCMTRTGTDEEGREYDIPMTAAEAAVLRAFLKDNNIQADPDASTDIRALSAGLAAATEGTVSAEELQAIFDDFANNPVTMQ
jgi:hypothetical protein